MLREDVATESSAVFVEATERRLRSALSAALGPEVGREAAASALAYGWEHSNRISGMENPVGYLYRVGRNLGGRMHEKNRRRPPVTRGTFREPWVEPGLPAALADLSERQRVVVWLLQSADWTLSEVAELLGISKSSVQRHAERGMAKLRRRMGVET